MDDFRTTWAAANALDQLGSAKWIFYSRVTFLCFGFRKKQWEMAILDNLQMLFFHFSVNK